MNLFRLIRFLLLLPGLGLWLTSQPLAAQVSRGGLMTPFPTLYRSQPQPAPTHTPPNQPADTSMRDKPVPAVPTTRETCRCLSQRSQPAHQPDEPCPAPCQPARREG